MAKETKTEQLSAFEYTKAWFAFAFEHTTIVRPVHGILYLWIVELNNRMGWAQVFSSPASQSMAACGINSYNTYSAAMNDLVEWGFVEMVTPSKNQYVSCKIALLKFDNTQYKALDKAFTGHLIEHNTKHLRSTAQGTVQSIDSIIKPQTINNKPSTNVLVEGKPSGKRQPSVFTPPTLPEVLAYFREKGYSEHAGKKAWDYYDAGQWKDSKGNQVKNWKQKMQGVWFKDEHKVHVPGSAEQYTKAIMKSYLGTEDAWTIQDYKNWTPNPNFEFLRYE